MKISEELKQKVENFGEYQFVDINLIKNNKVVGSKTIRGVNFRNARYDKISRILEIIAKENNLNNTNDLTFEFSESKNKEDYFDSINLIITKGA